MSAELPDGQMRLCGDDPARAPGRLSSVILIRRRAGESTRPARATCSIRVRSESRTDAGTLLLRAEPLRQEARDERSRLRDRHRVRGGRGLLHAVPCLIAEGRHAVHGVSESADLLLGGPAVLDHLVLAPGIL